MNFVKYATVIILFFSNILCQVIEKKYNHVDSLQSSSKINESLGSRLRSNEILKNNKKFQFNIIQSLFFNTNHPNLENRNGEYFPKGHGALNKININYKSKMISFSFSPVIRNLKIFNKTLPKKNDEFSVLNDTPDNIDIISLTNTGFKFDLRGLSAGFGNWNDWWGPAIHSSIIMSNNSEGFYRYFMGTTNYINLSENLYFDMKYEISKPINNKLGQKFYLSSFYIKLKYNFHEFGYNRSILSGGTPDLKWSNKDAFWVMANNKYIKYWDVINDFYAQFNLPKSKLEFFIDLGIPNRSFGDKNPKTYTDHSIGSIIGFRKKEVFGFENMIIGAEYARLVQSIYYNMIPSSNWYDNIKFNYSSYSNRRWGAHSGSDSDDFLVYFGYLRNNKKIIYGINYERHGVTYAFPPEVKLESRLSVSYDINKINISIYFENEYFEHFGFVDSNYNVWEKSFNEGSIQRTQTILFSIKYNLFN